MKCQCCDRFLSDYESTARHANTNEFLDTCLGCLEVIGIPFKGRKDLDPERDAEDNGDYRELPF